MQSRGKVAVYVAALEEPAIESVEEIENAVENQSTDSLYKRFDDLLEKTLQDYAVGDRVVGTVALCAPRRHAPLLLLIAVPTQASAGALLSFASPNRKLIFAAAIQFLCHRAAHACRSTSWAL